MAKDRRKNRNSGKQKKTIEKKGDIFNKKNLFVYISGAIANNPNYKEEFEAAEKNLFGKGFVPLNPVRLPEHLLGSSNKDYLLAAINMLAMADIMVQISPLTIANGMVLEDFFAKCCNIPIQNYILANKEMSNCDTQKVYQIIKNSISKEGWQDKAKICYWTDKKIMDKIASKRRKQK